MQDHTGINCCSTAVCTGNDTGISLAISHIYGAVFIDPAKVSDTADCTSLLQQFKHDTAVTVACFSSTIIGHWVLWGSWHCNSSAVPVLQRKASSSSQIAGLASFPSMVYLLTTACTILLHHCHSLFGGTCPQLAALADKKTMIFLNTLSAPLILSNLRTWRLPQELSRLSPDATRLTNT